MEARVIPAEAKRRAGIHAGTFIVRALAWISGQARDDDVVPWEISSLLGACGLGTLGLLAEEGRPQALDGLLLDVLDDQDEA
jgi:hypothetical protein